MIVELYKTTSKNNVVRKNLKEMTATTIHPFGKCDIMNPVFRLQTNINYFLKYNYAYVSEWKRYYFITRCWFEDGFTYIEMKEDVLMSYADDIENITCYVERQEQSKYINSDYVDDRLPISSKKRVAYSKTRGSLGKSSTIIINHL